MYWEKGSWIVKGTTGIIGYAVTSRSRIFVEKREAVEEGRAPDNGVAGGYVKGAEKCGEIL